jgi:hypothetical protein
MKLEEATLCTQVIYVPPHAEDDPTHVDREKGFVTSCSGQYVFCRFFSNSPGQENTLRTKLCSESCLPGDLIVEHHHSQTMIDILYAKYTNRCPKCHKKIEIDSGFTGRPHGTARG